MADLSGLSDEQLRSLYGGGASAPAPQAPSPFATLTDNELRTMALKAGMKNAGRAQPQPYSGSILPMSRDAEGNVSFDSNAGIIGTLKRAFMLPGEVAAGKVDPLSEEGTGRALEMAAAVSPVPAPMRAGERIIPGQGMAYRKQEVKPPSADALRTAASEGYDQARNMGVEYSSDAVRNMAQGLQRELETDGVIAELAPKSFSVLRKLQEPPAGSTASLSGMDAARRAFGHAGRDFQNPTDQLAAGRGQAGIDRFLTDGDPSSVVAGPAAAAGGVIKDARANYAAAMRSDRLGGIEEGAELSAAAANSGQNLGNSVRSRVASLLKSDKARAGFNDEELAALEGVVRGTPVRNAARFTGNMLGGGGGLGMALTGAGGAAAGGAALGTGAAVAGAALPFVGVAAKGADNLLTGRALSRTDALTRQRSPLYEQMQADAPMVGMSPEMRQLITRALLAMSPSATQGQ